MLEKALIKVSLREPIGKFQEMAALLKGVGTKKLFLVHVQTSHHKKAQQQVASQLEELAKKVQELGFEVQTYIKEGHVPSRVIDTAREVKADYICIYWLRKGIIKQALWGSIDSDILRMSDKPVFVYNRGYLGLRSTELESVLYATDFKYTDNKVMPYLLNKNFQAESLFLLHVGERAPDPYTEKKRKEKAKENLQRLASECMHAYDQIQTLDVVGRIKSQIIWQAKKNKADLIVIGKTDSPNPFKKLMGSTAEVIPNKAKCSVFIIP
mgnify:FL=1